MPKKLWQHPFVNLLKLVQHDKRQSMSIDGDVHEVMDRTIGKKVYSIRGSVSANNYLLFPAKTPSSANSLGLSGSFVYLHLKTMGTTTVIEDKTGTALSLTMGAPQVLPTTTFSFFVIHLEAVTKDDHSLRISVSNMYKEIKVLQNAVQIPCNTLNPTKWTVLALDLATIVSQLSRKTYKHLKSVQICSNLFLRNIFTSDIVYQPSSLPRDMYLPIPSGKTWEELYDWIWYPYPPTTSPEITVPASPQALGSRTPKSSSLTPRGNKTLSSPAVTHSTTKQDSTPTLPSNRIENPFSLSSLTRKQLDTFSDIQNDPFHHKPTHLFHDVDETQDQQASLLTPDPILECAQILGFNGRVTGGVLCSADSKKLIYPSHCTIVKLDHETRQQVQLNGHTEPISALAIDGRGQLLASVQSRVPLIRIWDFHANRCITMLKAHEGDVVSLHFSDTGSMLCAVGKDKHGKQCIALWDTSVVLKTGSAPLVLKQLSDYHIRRMEFVPFEDSKLVSCGKDNIRFWRIKNGALRGCGLTAQENCSLPLLATIQKQNFLDLTFERVMPGRLSNSGHRVYVSTDVGTVLQIDYTTRIVEFEYQLHSAAINSIFVSEGMCITGSDDKFMRIWPLDFADYFLEAEHEGPVTSVCAMSDGLKIAVGSQQGTIGILDVPTEKYQTLLRSHTAEIMAIAIDPNHAECATVSKDCSIRIWDLKTFDQLYQFDSGPQVTPENENGEIPRCIVYHPSEYVVACGFDSGVTRIFDIRGTCIRDQYNAHAGAVEQLIYTADGKWLITASKDCICIADAKHMHHVTKTIHFMSESESIALAVSPDNLMLAVVGPAGNVCHIYSIAQDFAELAALQTMSSDYFLDICFSPSSKELITITSDNRILVLDLATGYAIREMRDTHKLRATTVSVSSNNKYLVSGGSDGIVKVWEYNIMNKDNSNVESTNSVSTAAEQCHYQFQSFVGHISPISQVRFVPDCKTVVSIGGSSLIIWNFLGDSSREWSLMIDNYIDAKIRTAELQEAKVDSSSEEQDSIVNQPHISIHKLLNHVRNESQQRIDQSQSLDDPEKPVQYSMQRTTDTTVKKSHFFNNNGSGALAPGQAISHALARNHQQVQRSTRTVFVGAETESASRASGLDQNGTTSPRLPAKEELVMQQVVALPRKHYQQYFQSSSLAMERYIASPDSSGLHMQFITGFNGRSANNNLLWKPANYSSSGTDILIYTTRTVIVLQDLKTKRQRHLIAHTSEISTLASHPVKPWIASASGYTEANGVAPIILWDIDSAKAVKILSHHRDGVQSMAFSSDGNWLISIGTANDGKLVVWNVETGAAMAQAILKSPTHHISIFGNENNNTDDLLHFSTAGSKGVTCWVLKKSLDIKYYNAVQSEQQADAAVLVTSYCKEVPVLRNTLWAADNTGSIVAYKPPNAAPIYQWHNAHFGAIEHLSWSRNGHLITAGENPHLAKWKLVSKDDTVPENQRTKEENSEFVFICVSEINVDSAVVALQFDEDGNEGFVGTANGNIWYINFSDPNTCRVVVNSPVSETTSTNLLQSPESNHTTVMKKPPQLLLSQPVSALSMPVNSNETYYTALCHMQAENRAPKAGDTRREYFVTCCSSEQHNCVKLWEINSTVGEVDVEQTSLQQALVIKKSSGTVPVEITCVELDPLLRLVAYGCADGTLTVHPIPSHSDEASETQPVVLQFQDSITCTTITPDGNILLLGCESGMVLLVDISKAPSSARVICAIDDLQKNNQTVTNIDVSLFSSSENLIFATSTSDGSIVVWNVITEPSQFSDKAADMRYECLHVLQPRTSSDSRNPTALCEKTLVKFSTYPEESTVVLFIGPHTDNHIICYDWSAKKTLRRLAVPRPATTIDVSVSSHCIAMGSEGRLVTLVDYFEGQFQDFVGHADAVVSMRMNQLGDRLVSCDALGQDMVLWSTTL